MNNVAPLLVAYVQGTSTSSAKSVTKSGQEITGGTSFLAQFNALLSSEELVDLKQIDTKVLNLLMGSETSMEGNELEQLIVKLTEVLLQHPDDSSVQTLLENPELQSWIANTVNLLSSISDHNNKETNSQKINLMNSELFTRLSTENQSQVMQLQKTVTELLSVLQQQPQHEMLKNQQNELKEILKTFIHLMEQSSKASSVGKQSLVEENLTTHSSSISRSNELQALQFMHSRLEAKGFNSSVRNSNQEALRNADESLIQIVPVNGKTNIAGTTSLIPLLHKVAFASGMNAENANVEQSKVVTSEGSINTLPLQDSIRFQGNDLTQMVKTLPTPMNSQNLAEQMGPFMIKQMKIAQLNGFSEAKIMLTPENLGQVNIRITMQNGHMVAQFMTENMMGKELLEGQLSQLRAVLQTQGIQVDRLEVSQNNNTQSSLYQDHKQQQSSQQFLQQKKGKSEDYESYNQEFSLDLELETLHSNKVYGSSFNAMA